MPTFPLTFPIVFEGTSTPFDVAGDIINQAALEMGLAPNRAADPYASRNPLYVQLCALLQALGREMWKLRNWTQLLWLQSFTTTLGEDSYALPANLGRMLSGTAWNLGQVRGMDALTPQAWREYKSRGFSPNQSIAFRIQQQQFVVLTGNATPAGQTIAFEFISRWWVQTDGQALPDKDAPTAATDTIWFDPSVMTAGLKAKWRREKSMPGAQDAQDEYERLLALSMEVDGIPPTTNLLGRGGGVRRLDGLNLPDTLVP